MFGFYKQMSLFSIVFRVHRVFFLLLFSFYTTARNVNSFDSHFASISAEDLDWRQFDVELLLVVDNAGSKSNSSGVIGLLWPRWSGHKLPDYLSLHGRGLSDCC